MSGMSYPEAVKLLNKIAASPGLAGTMSDTMWKAIIDAVTDDSAIDDSAIYDPLLDPEFSLEEIEAAQKVIDASR